jgi:nucleoside-diphosphate-sugar epimerase
MPTRPRAMLRAVSGADDGPPVGRRTGPVAGGERVLLTGATGFLGSRVIEPLLQAGYDVHAVARRPGTRGDVAWHAVDLLDDDATAALVRAVEAQNMLHLAWYAEHGRFWESPENLSWAATSLRLLRAFSEAGGGRAVIAGTCAEYDWSSAGECCLELPRDGIAATPEGPATLYGAAKRATLLAASAYAETVGLSLAWGRVFLLYGPGEDAGRLVPAVARALLAGEEAATGDATRIRDFMHVDDVARGFVALLGSAVEGPVNIASGEGVALGRVLDLIAEAAGRPDLLRPGALPPRAGEPERLVADVQRLRSEVGFIPSIALEQGIAETVAWWRAASRAADELEA